MNTLQIEKIKTFLDTLSTSYIDVTYMVDIEQIDLDNPFQSIVEQVEDQNGFDVEIIYYATAMEYLTENDTSLRESLEIASDLGYETKNLNSELLASLLASQLERDNFYALQEEIETFFEELNEEISANEN